MSTRYGPILMTVSLVVVYRIRKLLRDEQRNETTSYTRAHKSPQAFGGLI